MTIAVSLIYTIGNPFRCYRCYRDIVLLMISNNCIDYIHGRVKPYNCNALQVNCIEVCCLKNIPFLLLSFIYYLVNSLFIRERSGDCNSLSLKRVCRSGSMYGCDRCYKLRYLRLRESRLFLLVSFS